MSLNAEVLEQSFARIKPQASQFAATFYAVLFQDFPEVQPLFTHSDMLAQQKKLVDSLVLVVGNLRNPGALVPVLKNLGDRHIQYGVVAAHYPMVGAALLKALALHLGEDWTPEVEGAWVGAFGAISELMQAA